MGLGTELLLQQCCQVGDFIARICQFWRIGAPSGYKKLFLAIRKILAKFWLFCENGLYMPCKSINWPVF